MTDSANPKNRQSNQNPSPIHNLITDTHKPKTTVNRRQFVGGVAVGAAALGLAACGDGDSQGFITQDKQNTTTSAKETGSFDHGVASGDPLHDRVILWTRINPHESLIHEDTQLSWVVAKDRALTDVVASGSVKAQAKNNFCVKVDATGLQPNTTYYYQFSHQAATSTIGKTKTLPAPTASVDEVTLAVFSCSNYPAGYFNVYAEAAKRGDFDVAVHLGDYIYEYARTQTNAAGETVPAYASAQAGELGREVLPATEIVGLNDYRARYAQYRSDPDLQALHAAAPMIAVWDDHEITNDAYKDGAENHQADEGDYGERKMAAMMAYHEWLPTRTASAEQIFRRFDFGNLVTLHMLDTRIIGRDKQLDYKNYFTATGLDAAKFTQDITNPKRKLLGDLQTGWLQQQMATSSATWQILGQQVLMARMLIPAPILAGTSVSEYGAIAAKAQQAPQTLTEQERAILAQPKIPYNLDAWDGYAVAREVVLGTAKQLGKNLVVLAGDTHNAWASNLTDKDGANVGVEFATSSVSSPGFEEYLANEDPATLAAGLLQLIDDLVYANTHQRGYMLVTATKDKCVSEWIFVDTVLSKSYTASTQNTLSVSVGEHKIAD